MTMPDLRALAISAGVGIGVALFLVGWWHWPLAMGGGAAIILAGLALVGTISVGTDPKAADEAWRKAAPDLVDPVAGPLPAVLPRADGAEEQLGTDAAP
jgi:hypothetical protein